MHHDWPVKKAIVDLLIKVKGKLIHTSGNSRVRWGPKTKDMGAAIQRLNHV